MSEVLGPIDGVAGRWAEWMWFLLWQSSLFGAFICLAAFALRRSGASLRCWLWVLLPIKLLIMPFLIVSLPLLPAKHALRPSAADAPAAEVARAAMPPPMSNPAPAASRGEVREILSGIGARSWLMAAWIVGVAFCALRLAVGWRRMRRRVARAMPATSWPSCSITTPSTSTVPRATTPPRCAPVRSIAT